jgi:hypothetical protein
MNFIIPYRNRKEHLDEFIKRFTEMNIDAHFYIIHQMNPGEFNRGAINNIGFLEVSKMNPDGLFIFHDVDTYPTYWGSIPYETKKGEINRPVHNSSPENLGLICCCYKEEFEKTNGFANYWGWGAEDAALYYRAKKHGIPIREGNIHYTDRKYVINHEHYRNVEKQHFNCDKNGKLLQKEKDTGDSSNGLSSIQYEMLSSCELAPRFTIMNVDFKIS